MQILFLGAQAHPLHALQMQAESLGVQLNGDSAIRVYEVLRAASLGRLRYREDLKLVKATLPRIIFEIRLDLFDLNFRVLKARIFVSECPPDQLLVIGQFLKLGWETSGEARTRQNDAAVEALRNLEAGA